MTEVLDFIQTDQLTLVFKYFTTYVLLLGLLKFAFDAPDIFKSIVGSLGDAAKGKFNGLLEAKKIGEDTKKAVKGAYDHSIGAAVNSVKNVVNAGNKVLNAGSKTLQTGLGVAGGVVGAKEGATEAAKNKTGTAAFGAGLVGGARGLVKGAQAAKGTKVSFIEGTTPKDAIDAAKVTATLQGIKSGDKNAAEFNATVSGYESVMSNAYGDNVEIRNARSKMEKADQTRKESEAFERNKRREVFNAEYAANRDDWEARADSFRDAEIAKKASKRGLSVADYTSRVATDTDIADEYNKIINKYDYTTLPASTVSNSMAEWDAAQTFGPAKDEVDKQKRDLAIMYGKELGKNIANSRDIIIRETNKVLEAQSKISAANAGARTIIEENGKAAMKKFSEEAEAKILESLAPSYTGVADCTTDFAQMKNMYEQIVRKSKTTTLSDQENAALKIMTEIIKDVSTSSNNQINQSAKLYESVVKANSGK